MIAVSRTAPTGAPSASAPADPSYTDNSPIAAQPTGIVRISAFSRGGSGAGVYAVPTADGQIVQGIQSHTPTANATYTGQTAVERASYIGTQVAAATGTSPATATAVVRDYKNRTGTYPDMSSLSSLGSGYTGGNIVDGAPQQLGLLSGGLNTWVILSLVGLVAVLLFGRKR